MSVRRPLATAAFALAVGLAASTAAHAGTYQVAACRDAPDGAAAAFAPANTSPATITVGAQCPPVPGEALSGLLVAATLAAPNTVGGAAGSWTISAPPGTTLQQLTVRRYLGKRDHDWDVAVRTADGTTLETCDFNPLIQLGCTVGSSTPTDPANLTTYTGLATSSVSAAIRCDAGPATCANGTSQRQAWIALYGATATIEDPAPPILGSPTGSLVGFGATAGWHRGIEQITAPATDASGIKRTSLLVDGTPIAAVDQTCVYTRTQPCPAMAAPTFAVDLSQIGDGTHELRVAATDAADQQQLSAPIPLPVDQTPPSAPLDLTATRNDGTYGLDWRNPDQGSAAPIRAAHYTVCEATAPTHCSGGATVAGPAITRLPAVNVPSGGRYDVRVWLEDEAGNTDPARSATVSLTTTTLAGGKTTRSAKLRAKRATRRGGVLTISGTIARNATGTVSATLARTRSGKRLLTANTRAKRGRWSLRIRLTSAQRRNPPRYLTLRYAGDKRHTQAKLRRRLVTKRPARRAAPSSGTLAEFDFETLRRATRK